MAKFHYSLTDLVPNACRGAMLTIGNFDGVHRGHQALIAEARRQAEHHRVSSVAVTFDPHPFQILRPDVCEPPLTTIDQRARLLQSSGANEVLVLRTTTELLQYSADEFFREILVRRLQARGFVEGFNFAFGRNREGTLEKLKLLCERSQLPLTLMPPVEVQGAPVSTSRVRRELSLGEVRIAAELLGRPYSIEGKVVVGQRRGQQLGFPTANLDGVFTVVPGDGVFATRVWIDGTTHLGAANIGPNPTFGENARKIEIHILDFRGDLYGKSLVAEFTAKLRNPRAFANVAELQAQIAADIAQVRELLASGAA